MLENCRFELNRDGNSKKAHMHTHLHEQWVLFLITEEFCRSTQSREHRTHRKWRITPLVETMLLPFVFFRYFFLYAAIYGLRNSSEFV